MMVAYAMMSISERNKTSSQPIVWTTVFVYGSFSHQRYCRIHFFTWKALALAMVERSFTRS